MGEAEALEIDHGHSFVDPLEIMAGLVDLEGFHRQHRVKSCLAMLVRLMSLDVANHLFAICALPANRHSLITKPGHI